MPFDLWISFFIAAAILVVAPGPDNIFPCNQRFMGLAPEFL